MDNLYTMVGIVNAVLMVCLIIGSYMAIRSGKGQQAGTLQSQAIQALQAELDSFKRRIDVLEKETVRLTTIITLIKTALRKHGWIVSIDGEMVTIENNQNGRKSHGRIAETLTDFNINLPGEQ